MEELALIGFIVLATFLLYLFFVICAFIIDTIEINNIVKQTRFYKEYMKKNIKVLGDRKNGK